MQYTSEEDEIMGYSYPFQIIPLEYQGGMFLAFVMIAFGLILYGFYVIATDRTIEVIK